MDIYPLISQEFRNQGDGLSLLHHFQFFILLDVLYQDLLFCVNITFCHFGESNSQGGTNTYTESCPKIKNIWSFLHLVMVVNAKMFLLFSCFFPLFKKLLLWKFRWRVFCNKGATIMCKKVLKEFSHIIPTRYCTLFEISEKFHCISSQQIVKTEVINKHLYYFSPVNSNTLEGKEILENSVHLCSTMLRTTLSI